MAHTEDARNLTGTEAQKVLTKEYEDWHAGLSEDQVISFLAYTAHYMYVNEMPRGGEQWYFIHMAWEDPQEQLTMVRYLTNIDSALKTAPRLVEDTLFYRGTSMYHYEGLQVGDTFKDDGYVSVCVDKAKTVDFVRDLLVTILAPAGSRGAFIDFEDLTENCGETEFIFPRGMEFKILDRRTGEITMQCIS